MLNKLIPLGLTVKINIFLTQCFREFRMILTKKATNSPPLLLLSPIGLSNWNSTSCLWGILINVSLKMVRSQISIKINGISATSFGYGIIPYSAQWYFTRARSSVRAGLYEQTKWQGHRHRTKYSRFTLKISSSTHTPQIWPVTPLTNTDYPKINFNKESNPLSTTRDWECTTRNTCWRNGLPAT